MGNRGDTVNAILSIVDNAAGLYSVDLTISYDTTLLDLANGDVTLSSYLAAQGWAFARNVDDVAGTARISLYSQADALPAGTPDLATFAFQVPTDGNAGTSTLGITGRLNEGQLTMTVQQGAIRVPITTAIVTDAGNANAEGGVLQFSSTVSGQSGAVDYLWSVTRGRRRVCSHGPDRGHVQLHAG